MIKPKFSKKDLEAYIKQKMESFELIILTRLQYIGETFVNNARNNGAYLDQTGNLRSSIGYVILKNGKKMVDSGFSKSKNGEEGQLRGKAFLKEIMSRYQKGYVLIVVAGMDYAAAVEGRGKDVLTASSIIAKAELKRAFKSHN